MNKIKRFNELNEGEFSDTNYKRVIPRDLFNEAKLLKCMGRLCLLVHDGKAPDGITVEDTGAHEAFEIGQNRDDGSISIINLQVSINGKDDLVFSTALNNKGNYPLYVRDEEYNEAKVFDEDGNFTYDFLEFCNSIKDDK